MNKSCLGKLPLFFLLLLLSLTSAVVQSQPVASSFNSTNWRFMNPKPLGFTIIDIDFFDNNKGVAVGGGNGTIAYTTDGGATWKYGAFAYTSAAGVLTSTSFQDVHFISSNVVYAVGTNGCMVKSTDGGATWSFVRTPFYTTAKNINTTWFLNENKGYIGGQSNTPDQTPKLYFTLNGGASWDSIAAPIGGKTRVGYPNNANVAPILWDVTAVGKEIQRIIFVNDNLGYISGSGLGLFDPIPNVSSTTTCLPSGTTSTGTHHASLLWKFTNGSLSDYSVSKERLGYNGIYNSAPACNYRFASNSVHTQSYRAFQIIDDTTVLLLSNTNNIIIKVSTGPNSFTPNINNSNLPEPGKYQLLNAPSPPQNNSSSIGAPIPANAIFTLSNPANVIKNASGKIFVPVASPLFGPVNRMLTSVDTGKTWKEESWIPPGRNYSTFGGTAIDLLPSGKFILGGQSGVMADSVPGTQWKSNYQMPVTGSFNKMDFADCANGMAVGGGAIARTADGGKNWTEVIRQDFVNLNIQINSGVYAPNNPSRAYFVTSVGNIYRSLDFTTANPTLDPVFSIASHQLFDVAAVGNDSVWACGYTTTPTTAQVSKVFRSTNGGNTWTTVNSFPTNPSATNHLLRQIEFPTRLVGYACGTRDTVWKTTDGGVTWNKLPLPTPGVTPQITYNDMFALDANTVFLAGVGFPRRVIFRTTDGGNTWQDITGNAATIFSANFNSVVFHDVNNGYVGGPGGALLITNNGGASWRLDIAPSFVGPLSNNNIAVSFAPKTVPAGTPFANRRLYVGGAFTKDIFEYGDSTQQFVSSSELIASSCNNVANGSVTITATGGIPPYTFRIDGGSFQSSGTFANVGAGSHTITVRDFACGVFTKTINVPVRPAPLVNAGPDRTIVEGDDAALSGGINTGTLGTFAWTPTSSIIAGATSFTPTVKPAVTTNYILTMTDANGCVGTDNAVVTVIPNCIKVMNAFTPNNDGQNDRWLVTNGNACVERIFVAVYNRYGNEVYRNENYQNDWDGTYKGKPVADGTYYYNVTFRTITGRQVSMKGDVTILR